MSKSYRDYPSCVQDFSKPIYHPVITKSEYLRETEAWQRQRRRQEITWRVASLVVLAMFAFLVLD
jgi:hypothetical protein